MSKSFKVAIDDGSTNVKVSWIANKTLKSIISPNSFRKEWKSAALLRNRQVYNYELGITKYTYDPTSEKSLSTTHIDYQYGDLNLLAVHHALLQTGIPPCDVAITVTLPITEYYQQDDCQRNEANIERKKQNLMRPIILNKGKVFNIVSVDVMPESLPAVLTRLMNSGVNPFTKTLVIDCGGTTLDMGLIIGEFDEISEVYGNRALGVSLVTNAVRTALAAADSDSSYLVANELIKRRQDIQFVREVINDESQIPRILEKLERKIEELGHSVAEEAKKFARNPNRIYLVGGGAALIYPAIQACYPTLGQRVILIDGAQSALSREICLYISDEEEVFSETAVTEEVGHV
ncbi:plasmid segregation protein ParM domain-containing protein [Enterobacter ludwigii]